ncbi:leucyl/phenylalanyl-tRNA--protein transferase [Thalassotalea sp. HSM 43]|uniref:leucyl/phenylalanyl-tRNA--protein transferase n=1 Tax=Thalassotalea sp. HSM 43 TaxID=2552945 RepID=UPI001080594C|nr:leucyl/phenylalanyl-tRNA--protein transferase [Thalassotalea sp. HSM 43]QBY05960.1 leucyl/phenylalanyl-tRNA--protein transferase [Thalassotalea sp. HSM 43]
MSQQLYALDDSLLAFPPTEFALTDPNGLLAVGGDLSPERLVVAYQNGIFPWYSEHDPILWWSPNPRAIIKTDAVKINRSLAKFIRKCDYQVTVNHAFEEVIDFCADAPFRDDDTWILPEMLEAYVRLHHQGHAHSVEVWQHGELIGGLYGVAVNGFFSGESMFYRKDNASKIALIALANKLRSIGVGLIDCQIQNPFLQSMGAVEISRERFMQMKHSALNIIPDHKFWLATEIAVS